MTEPRLTLLAATKSLFILRIIQFCASIALLAISATVVAKINSNLNYYKELYDYYGYSSYRREVKRDYYSDIVATFTFSWTILVSALFMFLPTNLNQLANPYFFLVIEILTNMLWIGNWIYLAVYTAKLEDCTTTICRLIRADTIASSIIWASFIMSTTIMIKSAFVYYESNGPKTGVSFLPGGYFPTKESFKNPTNSQTVANNAARSADVVNADSSSPDRNISSAV